MGIRNCVARGMRGSLDTRRRAGEKVVVHHKPYDKEKTSCGRKKVKDDWHSEQFVNCKSCLKAIKKADRKRKAKLGKKSRHNSGNGGYAVLFCSPA